MKKNINGTTSNNKSIGEMMLNTLRLPDTVFFVTIDRTQIEGKPVAEAITIEIKPAGTALAIVDQLSKNPQTQIIYEPKEI